METIKKDEIINDEIKETAEQTAETVEEVKPYTFRRLSSTDVFLMFRIISKIGVNEFTTCFGKDSVINTIKNMTDEQKQSDDGAMIATVSVMLEAANVILGNIGKCEREIYQMLANTSNLTIDEITAEGNGVLFLEMVVDFLKKEEFGDFFRVVSKLFK